jgi:hypothetical protein
MGQQSSYSSLVVFLYLLSWGKVPIGSWLRFTGREALGSNPCLASPSNKWLNLSGPQLLISKSDHLEN